MFQRFPMSLYLRGDVSAAHVIVTNEDEEAARRAEGFRGAWEPQEKAAEPAPEPAKRRPGRPRKVMDA
jgi:hypothetical protein